MMKDSNEGICVELWKNKQPLITYLPIAGKY